MSTRAQILTKPILSVKEAMLTTYHSYYRDLPNMAVQIDRQNADILRAWHQYTGHEADNNYTLANTLGIRLDSGVPIHDYASADIKVKILAPASKS
jgi:hypothetical protein